MRNGYGGGGLWPHQDFIMATRARLGPGESIQLEASDVEDIAPHFWKEEAPTIPEWFCRNCGAYDLTAIYQTDKNKFIVSRRA